MSAQLTLHRTSRELYDALPVDEQTSQGTCWKTIVSGGITLVFFPSHDVPADTATEATPEEVTA